MRIPYITLVCSLLFLCGAVQAEPSSKTANMILGGTATWQSSDDSQASGSVEVRGTGPTAVYTVRGSGAGIEGQRDDGFFAFCERSGNSRIQARLRWTTPLTEDWALAGLMIRDRAQSSASANAFVGIRGKLRGDLLLAQSRTKAGDETLRWRGYMSDNKGKSVTAGERDGVYLRLSRYASYVLGGRGDLCVYEYSLDGLDWKEYSKQVVKMRDPYALGIAVISHASGTAPVECEAAQVQILSVTPPPDLPKWIKEFPLTQETPGTGQ